MCRQTPALGFRQRDGVQLQGVTGYPKTTWSGRCWAIGGAEVLWAAIGDAEALWAAIGGAEARDLEGHRRRARKMAPRQGRVIVAGINVGLMHVVINSPRPTVGRSMLCLLCVADLQVIIAVKPIKSPRKRTMADFPAPCI